MFKLDNSFMFHHLPSMLAPLWWGVVSSAYLLFEIHHAVVQGSSVVHAVGTPSSLRRSSWFSLFQVSSNPLILWWETEI